jgi:TonB-linked SusC/RagA family outer membrane protein
MNRSTFRTLRVGAVLLALLAGAAGAAVAQNAVIRGTVRSDVGELIEGASIIIPEMALQTATAANGQYVFVIAALRARSQTVMLRYRMIGFRAHTQTLVVRPGEQVFDVTLQTDVNRLEDIVVTGVMEGTAQNQTTFSVARVDLSDVQVPAVNPLSQLAGRVPGVAINQSSGRPGSAPDVLLRGPTSINASGRSQEPLYIVDGVIISGGLPSINSQDIENIEVVKGAAGASLYGARAANGVINITTKSGRTSAEGMTFRFRSEAGASDIENEILLARQHTLLLSPDAQRFCTRDTAQPLCARSVDWVAETNRVNNYPGNWADLPVTFAFDPGSGTSGAALRQVFMSSLWPVPTYNAVRQLTTNQPFINNNIDVTGRMGGTQYFASGSQLRQAGSIWGFDGFNRYTARLNVDQRIGANVQLSLRTFYSRGYVDGASLGGNMFFRLTRQSAPSNLLARDTFGVAAGGPGRLYARSNIMNGGDQNQNPLMYTTGNGVTDNETSDRFIGGGTLRWQLASWADFETNFSYDSRSSFWNYQEPKNFRIQSINWVGNDQGYYRTDAQGGDSYNVSANLTLRHNLLRDLGARWMFRYLFERQDTRYRNMSGYPLAVVNIEVAANAKLNQNISSTFTSQRLIGMSAGLNLDYKQKLIGDFLLRRDGSSLFGVDNRWALFGRGSLAYRPSQESWWPWRDFLNEFKLRASYGTAGGRPSFAAQYETYSIGAGGALSPGQLGNAQLRPESNTEREFGADLELFRRVGVTLTYSHSDTRDQILPVNIPAATGFGSQWKNAGTLTNKTWELSVNVPVVRTRDLSWSWRFNYDRTRTVITELNVPPFRIGTGQQGATDIINIAEGERYGTMYGRYLLRGIEDCAKLFPATFQTSCGGEGAQFQVNSDGWLVWTGGYGLGQGLTDNLWMTQLPAASAPWGIALNWGMPITLRDSITKSAAAVPLGTGLPDWRFSISQTLQYRRLTVYALLEGVMGRSVWNEGRHWSYLDFINRDMDMRGVSPEVAKPIGYYYRASPPDHASGINGYYQILAPNNATMEDGTFAKLRELSVTYHLGQVGGVGNWDVSVIGRNVFTLTKYKGFDPETGIGGGTANSGLINAVDAYAFPTMRTFTFALSTSF